MVNKPMKLGRTISAIIFALLAVFCFWAVALSFNVPLLLIGIVALALGIYSIYKAYFAGREKVASSKKNDDFEL